MTLPLGRGPAVNALTLAEENMNKSSSTCPPDTRMLQAVENAFKQNDALVVAGHFAKDTVAASNYLRTTWNKGRDDRQELGEENHLDPVNTYPLFSSLFFF